MSFSNYKRNQKRIRLRAIKKQALYDEKQKYLSSGKSASSFLREAIESKDISAATKIIKIFDIDLEQELDTTTWLPLAYAAMQDDTLMVNLLVSLGAKLEGKSGCLQFTALHAASSANSSKACKALIDLGANPCSNNKNRSTPLHIASRLRCKEVLELLRRETIFCKDDRFR